MRLLNVYTMKLEEYFGSRIPDYAILSHCWGEEEVTFSDINGPDWREKRGAQKIEYGTSQCQKDNISYIWIDTCCIDKSSSTELSEAINSMYRWYEKSWVCYAYLEDVKEDLDDIYENPDEDTNNDSIHGNNDSIKSLNGNVEKSIRKSRWFTRGWTLQELIAPRQIIFFGKNWLFLGEKETYSSHPERSLLKLLSNITTIPETVLADPSERTSCSVAKRMSWAARRETTREEDMAYSLLGIFEVNMPLLYGEGIRAFRRLQEEIIKETDDQSLFAWGLRHSGFYTYGFDEFDFNHGILALSPASLLFLQKLFPFLVRQIDSHTP
ncbi:HET-domain-containing protein [Hyaloscypha hepaticicola]|uniref:HET-domain-containing protein n=1 Tax=Hyaloscypha hepaticicola TaxID=2082293 RepID=A0A2J6PK96_9HELO|nr:HET-domain-containing protein [Hyaloscypha hepaticicola]